jgi:hypothetical protein
MPFVVGINWYLKQKQKIEKLEDEVDDLRIYNRILKGKIKKYENNNIRTTRNGEDNHVVELSGRVHSARG